MSTEQPIAKVWRAAALQLKYAGVDTPLIDARLLIQHVLSISREEFLMDESELTDIQKAELHGLIARRVKREPIAQILGKREFYGREFNVTRDTLDPRPDSETLVVGVLNWLANSKRGINSAARILDLGTGTGCLLLTLLAEIPHSKGLGVDICNKALMVAKENATKLELNERVTFAASRWAAELADISEYKLFDIIVSNPPYIPTDDIPLLEPEVAEFESKLALDGGHDGLDCYREIIASLPDLLTLDGLVALEIGMGQEKAIEVIAHEHGLQVVEMRKDLAGITRVLLMQRMRT